MKDYRTRHASAYTAPLLAEMDTNTPSSSSAPAYYGGYGRGPGEGM